MADVLHGAAAPIPAAVRAADPTQHLIDASSVRKRATRMLALLDIARALPLGDYGQPQGDDSTDDGDKLQALLQCLDGELQALCLACDQSEGGAA